MAKQRFKGALNAATFPLVSTLQDRSVIQPQLDNNIRTTQAFYGTNESANYSIPQVLYCENVVPTAEGLQSVGYQSVIAAIGGETAFDQAIILRDSNENTYLFSPAGGKNYIYNSNTGVWVSTNPISAVGVKVSRAYVNGRTFVCYAGIGIFEYDSATNTFNIQALSGLTSTDVQGIGASSNYLLVFTRITVYWSSLIDPLDFVPSLTTGAGFSIPQDVKAAITTIIGTAGGFIIYTVKNAVAGVFTNNVQAPFYFREIGNAGGIATYEQVTSEQSSGPQYIWGTGGLQKITLQQSEPVSAEVNDFLAGRLWEYWDSSSKQLIQVKSTATEFNVKLTYIASRWLVVSYSVDSSTNFQYALIFDTTLKRWGKLKVDHVDCFPYPYSNIFGDLSYDDLGVLSYDDLGTTTYDGLSYGVTTNPPSKRTVAFLKADGSVSLVLMDYNKDVTQQGVAIFGKFQLIRARMMGLQYVDFEGFERDSSAVSEVTVTALVSLDGKNLDRVVPMVLTKNNNLSQRWAKRCTGLNISLAVEGTFALTTYVVEATDEGDR